VKARCKMQYVPSSGLIPNASMAAANAPSLGSMCGNDDVVSATASRSKNFAPTMRPCVMNSSAAERFWLGRYHVQSRTCSFLPPCC